MAHFLRTHRKFRWTLIVLTSATLLVVVFLSVFNWNLLRPALGREITAKTGRYTSIDGDLKVHLFSWNPSAEVNGITMKNPPWAERDIMFGAKRVTLSVSLGWLLRGQIVISQLALIDPMLNLERDAQGRASWELGTQSGKPNGNTPPVKIPTIRSLLIEDGKLHVVDQIRKLRFAGSLVAAEKSGTSDPSAFRIRVNGILNEKPFMLEAHGGPLLDLTPNKPYSLSSHLTASDIDLQAHVIVPKPFDLNSLNVEFIVSGKDLADFYYLTGLALPNTSKYRFAASVQVSGTTYRIDNLNGQLGSSDLSGRSLFKPTAHDRNLPRSSLRKS